MIAQYKQNEKDKPIIGNITARLSASPNEYPSPTLRQLPVSQRSSKNNARMKELVEAATKTGR